MSFESGFPEEIIDQVAPSEHQDINDFVIHDEQKGNTDEQREYSPEVSSFLEDNYSEILFDGVPKQDIANGVEFYKDKYPELEDQELLEILLLDVAGNQINKYSSAIQKAKQEFGTENGANFEQKLLEVESAHVLKALAGNEESVKKVNCAFVDTEFAESQALEDLTTYDPSEYSYDFEETTENEDNAITSEEESLNKLQQLLKFLKAKQKLFEQKGEWLITKVQDLIQSKKFTNAEYQKLINEIPELI